MHAEANICNKYKTNVSRAHVPLVQITYMMNHDMIAEAITDAVFDVSPWQMLLRSIVREIYVFFVKNRQEKL